MNIYSIKNEKLSFFNRPIYCESDAEALSYIQNVLMSDADRALLYLKDDLSLYKLGEINFVTGDIDPCNELVCGLTDIFNTIPEEKLPRDSKQLRESISKVHNELNSRIDTFVENLTKLEFDFTSHTHKKEKK